jgi:hypothetical protein
MNFQKVDQSFYDWAQSSGLNVQTEYKGETVRSTDIFDINNQKWQLWLVPVDSEDKCVIHYWNYNDISRHSKVSNFELFQELAKIEKSIKTGTVK